MQRLIREDKIVADLFPAQIRARMYDDDDGSLDDGEFATDARSLASKRHVERFKDDLENPDAFKSAPLADLYLNTTILFAGKAIVIYKMCQLTP